MKVYICGDRRKISEFDKAEKLLRQEGHAPVNPLKIINALPEEITNSDFTVLAFEIIRICDAIYLLNGWEKDLFARMEKSQAERTDKTILK